MRSPHKPGYEPLWPPVPSWVGNPSDDQLSYIGGAERMSDLTISDKHFQGIDNGLAVIFIREYDNVVIERCTFALCGDRMIELQLCTNVTIRDCAFFNLQGTYSNFVLSNDCDGVTVEDCWGMNQLGESDAGDIVTLFWTDNGTVRRNRFIGNGPYIQAHGILVGDGDDSRGEGTNGGDNLVVEDNLLIDLGIAAIGTNNIVRRNTVLMRGLDATLDGVTAGIMTQRNNYPTSPMGPTEVSNNEVLAFNSTGQQDPAVEVGSDPVVTGVGTNPVSPLIDEYSRWDLTGYYGAP